VKRGELLITTFRLGYLKPAPGTWGSLPPPAIVVLLSTLLGLNGLSPADFWIINLALLLLVVVFSHACAAYGDWAEARFWKKDPGQVVADETAGQALTLLALPWRAIVESGGFIPAALYYNVAVAATAFLAFRFFDITKPAPARGLQRWPAGWGILVDDLIAGLYALIATQLLARLLWPCVFP